MYFESLISFIICCVILILYNLSQTYYKTKFNLITPLTELFLGFDEIFISTFQKIYLFPSNDIVEYLAAIITLNRQYDPTSILFPQSETIILTGKCKARTNAFYIRKNQILKHLGIKYMKKSKESGRYKVYGNKKLRPFIEKFNVEKLKISYFPKVLARNCSYKCIFYMEISVKELEKNSDLFNEFLNALNSLEDCGEEKFLENKLKYEKDLATVVMKTNIKEREIEMQEKRQIIDKKKKKDKFSRVKIMRK